MTTSVAEVGIKEVVRRARAMQEECGLSAVLVRTGENALARGLPISTPLQSDTRLELNPLPTAGGGFSFAGVKLRALLWNTKFHEVRSRPDCVVWTVYDPTRKVIVAGLGSLSKEVFPGDELLPLETPSG